MNQDERAIVKRMQDLAQRAYMENRYYNTRFLNELEQALLLQSERELPIAVSLFGGYENAERKIAVFGNEDTFGYETELPIVLLHIVPASKKFAEQLTHRDVLGALMHLGIERELIGDIILKEKEGYLFCMESMAEYIMQELYKIRHTIVTLKPIDLTEAGELSLATGEEEQILVPSLRLDAVIAAVYRLSRQEAQTLIREKKVFVSGRLNENNSGLLKDDMMISVRGKGRFHYCGVLYTTKKEKLQIKILRY